MGINSTTDDATLKSMTLPEKPTRQDLESIYQSTVQLIDAKQKWYDSRRWRTMAAGISVRVLGFCGLAAGVLFPLIDGSDFKRAYFALLLGGLVISADQIFMFSKTWGRRMQAQLALGALRDQLTYDWLLHETGLSDDTAGERSSDLLTLLKTGIASANDIVLKETTNWQADLDLALKTLVDRLDSTTKSVADDMDRQKAATEDRAKPGALNLTVRAKEILTELVISVGSEKKSVPSVPASVSFQHLTPGALQVNVDAVGPDGKPRHLSKAIDVAGAKITDAEIAFP